MVTAAALPPMEVAPRIDRLRARFDELACDAVLVTNLASIRYLTGFTGSAAMLLVAPDRLVFTTDGRYGIQSSQQLGAAGVDAEIVVAGGPGQRDAVVGAVKGAVARLGLEAGHVTWAQQQAFAQRWFEGVELVATTDAVERLRMVKDAGEVARIRDACRIADQAFAAVLPMLAQRPSEAELALALDFEMRRRGADDISFDTIIASGPNGAKAHHEPSARTIAPGELVVCDFGAMVDGYHSDMTRTVCVGEPASPTLQKMYDVVHESQRRGVDAVRAGVRAGDVDDVCRSSIAEHGWADAFSHSTGHGVGLDIHEAPGVAAGVDVTLEEGFVVTVEPGVYLPEHGGVRIEDTVVVTADGCTILTEAPKDLVVA